MQEFQELWRGRAIMSLPPSVGSPPKSPS